MPRPVKELVITVSGYHGSGRSTNAKLLAESLGLRYLSSGMIFRKKAQELGVSLEKMNKIASEDDEFDRWLDAQTTIESKKRGLVVDANLSAFMADNPDLKVFVTCPFEVRVQRIASRECRDYAEVEHETFQREKSEKKRYLEYYNVDIEDLSVYDVILNTSLFDIEATSRILKAIVEEYISGE